ncbi:MAG: hypothetical protein QM736_17885 [Vicinamibacterales bacterium]
MLITHRGTSIHLEARVMRGDMSSASSAQDGAWHAGIKFVAPPPIEITQLLRRIVSVALRAFNARSGTHRPACRRETTDSSSSPAGTCISSNSARRAPSDVSASSS